MLRVGFLKDHAQEFLSIVEKREAAREEGRGNRWTHTHTHREREGTGSNKQKVRKYKEREEHGTHLSRVQTPSDSIRKTGDQA